MGQGWKDEAEGGRDVLGCEVNLDFSERLFRNLLNLNNDTLNGDFNVFGLTPDIPNTPPGRSFATRYTIVSDYILYYSYPFLVILRSAYITNLS